MKSWNVGGVYESGINHDEWVTCFPNKRLAGWVHYIGDLIAFRVKWYKIIVLGFGLGIYEISPKWLKLKWKGIT